MSYLEWQTQNASLAAENERLQMELNTWTTLVALLRIHGYNCVSEQVTFYPFWWWEVIGVANQENFLIGAELAICCACEIGPGPIPAKRAAQLLKKDIRTDHGMLRDDQARDLRRRKIYATIHGQVKQIFIPEQELLSVGVRVEGTCPIQVH